MVYFSGDTGNKMHKYDEIFGRYTKEIMNELPGYHRDTGLDFDLCCIAVCFHADRPSSLMQS